MIESALVCPDAVAAAASPRRWTERPWPALDQAREAAAARAVLPRVRPGTQVLDLACGAGWSTLLLAARVGPGGRVRAWDPDPAARGAACAVASRAGMADRIEVLNEVPWRSDRAGGSSPRDGWDFVHLGPRLSAENSTLRGALTEVATHLRKGGCASLSLPEAQIARGIETAYATGCLPLGLTGAPILRREDVPGGEFVDLPVLVQPVEDRIGLPVDVHLDRDALLARYGLTSPGELLEPDLDQAENALELFGRKRRDAEVLCGLAASFPGPCLDLGTSSGRSAYRLATNVGRHNAIVTVNMLPEQAAAAGVHITHVLQRQQIGAYLREHGVTNVRQVYANTLQWDWAEVPCGLHLAFIDACHDAAAVYADSRHAWARLAPGGFLVWHDFSPGLAAVHPWIESTVAGVRAFCDEVRPAGRVCHLLGSWCGVLRKGDDGGPDRCAHW